MFDILSYGGFTIIPMFIGIVIILINLLIFLRFFPIGLWVTALFSGVRISIITLLTMRLRRVNPSLIVLNQIKLWKAGLKIGSNELEAHYLAGGNPTAVSDALIAADKASLNLSFERGKFYAILGANGSGKTTLCNIIRGFIPNFFQGEMKGKVIIDGKNLEEYEMGEIASKIGYVFQNPFNQITGARDTVYGEIAYGLENFGVPVAEIKTRVEKIMEITNTTYLQEKNPFELSGGQQQRVALASVLVLEPDILVIDEPTSQLDPQETERVFEIIKTMKKMGKTIILVEHKMELVAEYCDEVVVLHQGKVIRHGDKHDVLSEIELEKFGAMLPLTVYLANELKKHGVRMKDNIITSDEMADQLQKICKKY